MTRDKNFILNSIKMDLHRVVTATGDLSKELPKQSVLEFLEHAHRDFDKIDLSDHERSLQIELQDLTLKVDKLYDPLARLRWVEDIMTIRCRL